MSDDFPFAFGQEAADQFKERLKDLMRAQQEAFEEVQSENPLRTPSALMPDRLHLLQQAIVLTAAGLGTLAPQATPEAAADAMVTVFSRALGAVHSAARPPTKAS